MNLLFVMPCELIFHLSLIDDGRPNLLSSRYQCLQAETQAYIEAVERHPGWKETEAHEVPAHRGNEVRLACHAILFRTGHTFPHTRLLLKHCIHFCSADRFRQFHGLEQFWIWCLS